MYYVGSSDIGSYLITTPEGHVIIDGGYPETAPMIEAHVAQLEFKIADVKTVAYEVLNALDCHIFLGAHAGTPALVARVIGWAFVIWGTALYWWAAALYLVQMRRLISAARGRAVR